MREVYLTYVEKYGNGCGPWSVTFFAGLSPINLTDDNIKISLNHVLATEDSPRRVLEKLEKMALEEVGQRPNIHDILQGQRIDSLPKYANYERESGYLAEGGWPKKGETRESAEKRARKNTATRNKKLLKIYRSYVASISARPLK